MDYCLQPFELSFEFIDIDLYKKKLDESIRQEELNSKDHLIISTTGYRAEHDGNLTAYAISEGLLENILDIESNQFSDLGNRFSCPECSYTTTRKGTLKCHIMAIHGGQKPYVCNICNFRSTQMSNLKAHVLTVHGGEKPHHCALCSYKSARKSNLRTHVMAVHGKERPHHCDLCNYSAAIRSDLRRHIMSVHNKIKPHRCTICNYSASAPNLIRKHMKTHSTDNRTIRKKIITK